MEPFYIVQIIISALIAIITIYLIALFIKSETFKSYSCFNILLMSIILFFDCFILALTVSIGKKANQEGKFILLLFKTFFDKMILSVLSLQVIIVYAGIIHTDYYYSHEKSFVKIGNAICAIISGALAAIYTSIRWVKDDKGNSIFDYDLDDDNNGKIKMRSLATKIIETIFCGINLIVIVFFLVVVILHISKKRREAKAGLIQDLGYGNQILRFSLIFSVNIILIIYSGIISNFSQEFGLSKLKGFENYNGIVFLIICFLIELCFMINKTIYQETLKIFCKKKYKETEEVDRIKSVSTFDIDPGDDDDDDN
jgi:hypothetical protein